MPKSLLACLLFTLTAVTSYPADSSIPENFRRENLVAWCIVPFDAKKRGPEARAKMLVDLGLKRSAYDWRSQHVVEEKSFSIKNTESGSLLSGMLTNAFMLFKKHQHPTSNLAQLKSPKSGNRKSMIEAAAKSLTGLAKEAGEIGCKLDLYNHGGWGGDRQT